MVFHATLTRVKEKALNTIFGPLQETLKQKSRIVYAVLAVTFFVAFLSLVIALANRKPHEPTYWYDPKDVVMIEQEAYVTVYQR